MAGASNKSLRGIVPLEVKEVTRTCIAELKAIPSFRKNEGESLPANFLPDKLIPQANDTVFPHIYVTNQLIKNSRLDATRVNLFPNYVGRIFEIGQNSAKQLLLVGLSNDYDLDSGGSFPYLIYIPPSPQDSPKAHKNRFPQLYAKTPLKDIPYRYKDDSNYPYSWDWLYFQLFMNMYKLSYQLKKADKPYVFVVPLIRSAQSGLGILNSAVVMERCLLGIQKFYLDERFKEKQYSLQDIKHITIASFSIGNSILSSFILQNRENPFFRNAVKDLIILDPPFGRLDNRSPIINNIISVMRTNNKMSIFLYTQDDYYIQPLIRDFLRPKKLSFELSKDKIFSNPLVRNVFFAYLRPYLFPNPDPIKAHNTFPYLFINDAVARSSLSFRSSNGRLIPNYPF
jgi:hypothetical protein